jgi:hypothetical protein
MATRKQAPAEVGITTTQLSEFLGAELPGSEEQIATALELSTAAAERFLARPLPDQLSHNLAQGVRLLAASLLLSHRLEEPPADADIPLVVRYYWKLEG